MKVLLDDWRRNVSTADIIPWRLDEVDYDDTDVIGEHYQNVSNFP